MLTAFSLHSFRKFESRQFSELTSCHFCHHNPFHKAGLHQNSRNKQQCKKQKWQKSGITALHTFFKRAHTCKKMTKVCTALKRFHPFKQFKHLHTFPLLIFLNLTLILLNCKYRDCKLFLHCLIAPGILRIRAPEYEQGTLLILSGFHLP